MRYAELAIIGSFVFGVVNTAGVGKHTSRPIGSTHQPNCVCVRAGNVCDVAVPAEADCTTPGDLPTSAPSVKHCFQELVDNNGFIAPEAVRVGEMPGATQE